MENERMTHGELFMNWGSKKNDEGLEAQEEIQEQITDGKRAKELRKLVSMSRTELAAKIGIERDELLFLEQGYIENDLRRKELLKIIEELVGSSN